MAQAHTSRCGICADCILCCNPILGLAIPQRPYLVALICSSGELWCSLPAAICSSVGSQLKRHIVSPHCLDPWTRVGTAQKRPCVIVNTCSRTTDFVQNAPKVTASREEFRSVKYSASGLGSALTFINKTLFSLSFDFNIKAQRVKFNRRIKYKRVFKASFDAWPKCFLTSITWVSLNLRR